ncbi:hypothetical protein [Trichoplusia ni ascovirus 6b]|nr:hypothetical protein [Trichoplusia ni ascovirus 6b]
MYTTQKDDSRNKTTAVRVSKIQELVIRKSLIRNHPISCLCPNCLEDLRVHRTKCETCKNHHLRNDIIISSPKY